jgi:hypothetical protein
MYIGSRIYAHRTPALIQMTGFINWYVAYVVEAHPGCRDPAGDGGGDDDVAPASLEVRQREVGRVHGTPEVEVLQRKQSVVHQNAEKFGPSKQVHARVFVATYENMTDQIAKKKGKCWRNIINAPCILSVLFSAWGNPTLCLLASWRNSHICYYFLICQSFNI